MTIDEAAAVLILESYMTSVAAATKGKDEGL